MKCKGSIERSEMGRKKRAWDVNEEKVESKIEGENSNMKRAKCKGSRVRSGMERNKRE